MKKLFAVSMLAVLLAVPGLCGANTLTAAPAGQPGAAVKQQEGKRMPSPPRMRRPQMSREEAAERLYKEYGADKAEISKLLEAGQNYNELNTAYLYAALAKTPVSKVLELREQATWGRVRVQLGMDAGSFAKRNLDYQLNKLPKDGALSRTAAQKYTQQGYSLADIKRAAVIAVNANKALTEVLPLKTAVKDWNAVEAELGLAKPDEHAGLRGRGQRSGAGFAGLHVRNMTKERALKIFHDDYLFSEEELAPLYDELGFDGLEDVCLHAYMGRVPLQKIMEMRGQYSWDRIKYLLGLTPQVYFDRCVDYQARRLLERMDIPQDVTKDFMRQGYAMHHVNTAYLLAAQSGKPMAEIIVLKTPKNRWSQVAESIGVSAGELREAQTKISQAFGRHEGK